MDFGSLFSAWSTAPPAAASSSASSSSGVHLEGLLCSATPSPSGALVVLRVRPSQVPESPVFAEQSSSSATAVPMMYSVSVKREVAAEVGPLDVIRVQDCFAQTSTDGRRYVHARAVVRLRHWREVVEDDAFMASELVPATLPSTGKSAPFVIYSGIPGEDPQLHVHYGNRIPGLHRKWLLGSKEEVTTTGNDQFAGGQLVRRLTYKFDQRQWRSAANVRADMEVLHLQVTLWEAQCRRLAGNGLGNLDTWTTIMSNNCIPFYAIVVTDGTRSGFIRLSAIGVRWMLREYLEEACVELTATQASSLLQPVASPVSIAEEDGVMNVSALGSMPPSPREWRFYALTANPTAASASELAGHALVILAVRKGAEEPEPKRPRADDDPQDAETSIISGKGSATTKKAPAKKK